MAAGVLTTDKDLPLPQRLALLADDLAALYDSLTPDVVAVERVFFQVNARTAMSVGQASGLALEGAARRGFSVVQYTANEVKEAIAGYGSATKEQLGAMVAALCGLPSPPDPPDVTDALGIALCHLSRSAMDEAIRRATGRQSRPSPGGVARARLGAPDARAERPRLGGVAGST